jgi:hypothetical protein
VSEQEPKKEENRRPPSGPVSSPRAYFGRASLAATGALRNGISGTPAPGPEAAEKRAPVFRVGDPALRLFSGFELPFSPTTPLTGAIATLTGVRDGDHEKLFVDLGTSLVRAARQHDEERGTLTLTLSRTQSTETYSTLLASLRYVNDAPAPAPGIRRIALQILDAGGAPREVAEAQFGVGEAPRDENAAADAAPAPAESAAARDGAGGGDGTADPRLVIGETLAFSADGGYTVFWWPNRLPAQAGPVRRAAQPAEPSPEAAAGSFFSAGGKLYRLFEPPAGRAAPPLTAAPLAESPGVPAPALAPAYTPPAPLAASAVLSAQTPAAANDTAPLPQRAANDSVWVPGRGVPPPGFARPSMLRLEDIFGSDMQDAIARRLIDMRIAATGG